MDRASHSRNSLWSLLSLMHLEEDSCQTPGQTPGWLSACSPGSRGEGPPALTFTELPGFRLGTQVRRERLMRHRETAQQRAFLPSGRCWRRPGAQPVRSACACVCKTWAQRCSRLKRRGMRWTRFKAVRRTSLGSGGSDSVLATQGPRFRQGARLQMPP